MINLVKRLYCTNSLARTLMTFAGFFGLTFAGSAFAASAHMVPTGIALSSLSGNVGKSVSELATVLSDVSLIAGIGFVMASFFKFHQHKLNPQQVPMSQGITLLLIGAALTLFPTMLPTATHAVFGSSAGISQVSGSQINSLIGGSS